MSYFGFLQTDSLKRLFLDKIQDSADVYSLFEKHL